MFGELGMVFASLTLVVILADSGMDMHVLDLKKYWLGMVQVTTFSFLLSMVVASVVAHYMAGMNWISSILLSGMIAGTGASIVIPMVKQMKVSEKTRTVLSLESAISAVLCIVVTLAILQGYSMGEVSYLAMVFKLLASLGVALILGVVGGLLWSGLLGRVRTLKNSMFLTPAFVIILYGIAEWMGYSGAIAALAFGIVLGNVDTLSQTWIYKPLQRWITPQPLKDNERSFIKEIVFLVKTFFFVYIGIKRMIFYPSYHADILIRNCQQLGNIQYSLVINDSHIVRLISRYPCRHKTEHLILSRLLNTDCCHPREAFTSIYGLTFQRFRASCTILWNQEQLD
jgi:NhaP-type Na+/H+ or K+/H+ antiporter